MSNNNDLAEYLSKKLRWDETQLEKYLDEYFNTKQSVCKDWEIVSYKSPYTNDIIEAKSCESWDGSACSIYSVKRSDGEVFSVGDEVYIENVNDKIFGFKILKLEVMNSHSMMAFYNTSNSYNISVLKKVNKQPLFTTHDNVPIYSTTALWIVFKDFTYKYGIVGVKGQVEVLQHVHVPENNKYFSTEEAAKEYILMNKPCISMWDILSYGGSSDLRGEYAKVYTKELKQLAQSKLKQ